MFKPFSRSNPCPVCGEASPDCRYQPDGELILCHSHIDFDPVIPTGIIAGPSDNGVWGVFVPEKISGSIAGMAEKKAQREAERIERETAKRKGALGVEERDTAIRSLSKYLGLSRRHRQALLDRGLTDSQIEAGLFFTINPGDQVPVGIPTNLPGVINGKIMASGTGYACPAFDVKARRLGIRSD